MSPLDATGREYLKDCPRRMHMSLTGRNGKGGEKSPGKVKNRVDPMEAGRGKGWVIADVPGSSNLARR